MSTDPHKSQLKRASDPLEGQDAKIIKTEESSCDSTPNGTNGDPVVTLSTSEDVESVQPDELEVPGKVSWESQVGILCYRTPGLAPCQGIIKHISADFLVQEVGCDGQVVEFHTAGIPREEMSNSSKPAEEESQNTSVETAPTVPEPVEATEPTVGTTEAKESAEGPIPKDQVDQFQTWLSAEQQTQLLDMLEKQDKQQVIQFQSSMDKEARREFHCALRKVFEGNLQSRTVEGQLEISWSTNRQLRDPRDDKRDNSRRGRGRGRGRGGSRFGQRESGQGSSYAEESKKLWQSLPGSGPHLMFTMCKDNRDTMDAIQIVGALGGIYRKHITYAGIKDRRAITTQRVTCQRASIMRLASLNEQLHGIRLGDFCRVPELLKMGSLYGNRFTIILRHLTTEESEARASVEHWLKNGFVNYFGLQRFGTTTSSTHRVGAALLSSQWQEAVQCILNPRQGGNEREAVAQARQEWVANQDPKAIMDKFPNSFAAERAILHHLAKRGLRDYAGAMQAIPYHLLTLYLHSYQSYVWNHMVSARISRYGSDALVKGDLVMSRHTPDLPSTDGETPTDVTADASAPVASTASFNKPPVQVYDPATMADQYTLADLVLPLPGFDVLYPTHDINAEYVTFMQRDGLDPHAMKRNVKTYSLPGSYRHVFAMPQDAQYQFLRYADPQMPLVVTDWDRATGQSVDVKRTVDDGPFSALQLSFTLQSSQYATMCLRELTRACTSQDHHMELSKKHNNQES
ncbi:multisubstrate pseudouridine synthase 7 [Dispira parvispora]|uniref:Multisubstrate pseudouridine synthase 7 n=1 Tax=Dispira parvispora TaxID=1520584 RepID=A0A9W8AWR1_9FUNG|nr:multisubstrate pseudouridine synthase 7 [Dispira parvispora]